MANLQFIYVTKGIAEKISGAYSADTISNCGVQGKAKSKLRKPFTIAGQMYTCVSVCGQEFGCYKLRQLPSDEKGISYHEMRIRLDAIKELPEADQPAVWPGYDLLEASNGGKRYQLIGPEVYFAVREEDEPTAPHSVIYGRKPGSVVSSEVVPMPKPDDHAPTFKLTAKPVQMGLFS